MSTALLERPVLIPKNVDATLITRYVTLPTPKNGGGCSCDCGTCQNSGYHCHKSSSGCDE